MLCHTRGVRRSSSPAAVLFGILLIVTMISTACGGGEAVQAGDRILPTPEPAPTVAGQVIEVPEPEFKAETVLIGISINETLELRALPGLDQPVSGEVPAGSPIDVNGNAFETEDGVIWWEARSGNISGWMQPRIAYRGRVENITDSFGGQVGVTYPSALALADEVARIVAADEGAQEIITVASTEVAGQFSATVTVDILTNSDDSVAGERVIVTADGRATQGASWTLNQVLKSPLCHRGTNAAGTCE